MNRPATAKHILITGERNVGKSKLIERLLSHVTRPRYGFITKNTLPDAQGFHDIYIYRADDRQQQQTPQNKIGRCDTRIHDTCPEVFDALGVDYLRAEEGGIIVMDEIGFMETRSPLFLDAIRKALDGDIPVIAAVKVREDIPFLNEVRAHPNATVYHITPKNRDALYEQLLPLVKGLN